MADGKVVAAVSSLSSSGCLTKKEQSNLPDIASLNINDTEDLTIDYYLLEEDSQGDEKMVHLKTFTPKSEKEYANHLSSGGKEGATTKENTFNQYESDTSSPNVPTITSSDSMRNENEGYNTEDEVSQDILPIDHYNVAAAVVSDYENNNSYIYKPFNSPTDNSPQGGYQFQPQQQQPMQAPQENQINNPGMNYTFGLSTPPQNFPQPAQHTNYGPVPTPVYSHFHRSGLDFFPIESVPTTPYQFHHVPSSPIVPLSAGYPMTVPTALIPNGRNAYIPTFTNYSPPTCWLDNKINQAPKLLYGGNFQMNNISPIGPCNCIKCLPKVEITQSSPQPWISYSYPTIQQPISFIGNQQQQMQMQPQQLVNHSTQISPPSYIHYPFNATAPEYRPPVPTLRLSKYKKRTANKKPPGQTKWWQMSRWSEEVEKAEEEENEKKITENISLTDSGVEVDVEEQTNSESNSSESCGSEEVSTLGSSTTSPSTNSTEDCPVDDPNSSSSEKNIQDTQLLTWVPNMYLVMMDGKISEKAPECFRIRDTEFTLVDYGCTYFCMGEELPFVSNNGHSHFRNQIVSSAELKYQYYVPPMVENYDFFGGQQNLWQMKMMHYFNRFMPTTWRLQALPEVVHHKQKGWIHYSIVSKLRFCCRSCLRPWTTMRGKIMFTFSADASFSLGLIFMKIFGQVCMQKDCTDRDFQTAANYPEEIDRIMKKLSHYIAHMYYRMPLSVDYYDQNNSPVRGGNPKSLHRRELCQACFQGMCSKT